MGGVPVLVPKTSSCSNKWKRRETGFECLLVHPRCNHPGLSWPPLLFFPHRKTRLVTLGSTNQRCAFRGIQPCLQYSRRCALSFVIFLGFMNFLKLDIRIVTANFLKQVAISHASWPRPTGSALACCAIARCRADWFNELRHSSHRASWHHSTWDEWVICVGRSNFFCYSIIAWFDDVRPSPLLVLHTPSKRVLGTGFHALFVQDVAHASVVASTPQDEVSDKFGGNTCCISGTALIRWQWRHAPPFSDVKTEDPDVLDNLLWFGRDVFRMLPLHWHKIRQFSCAWSLG